MIKNAVELIENLDINLKHLQKAWAAFILDKNKSPEQIFTDLRNILTEDEINFLMYLGLNTLSNNMALALQGIPTEIKGEIS